MISILDYGAGNIRSVMNALRFLGAEAEVTNSGDFKNALIVPGQGSFNDAARGIAPFKDALIDFINSGKLFLGICIGMQLLFEDSKEGTEKGLGIFEGTNEKFPATVKLPQMGWNQLNLKKECILFNNIKEGSYVYFVHSYFPVPKNQDVVAATCNYGKEFTAVVAKNNVFATQFHPEKSGEVGLQMLKNFLNYADQKGGVVHTSGSRSDLDGMELVR